MVAGSLNDFRPSRVVQFTDIHPIISPVRGRSGNGNPGSEPTGSSRSSACQIRAQYSISAPRHPCIAALFMLSGRPLTGELTPYYSLTISSDRINPSL